MTQEEETSLLFAEIESVKSLMPHRSGSGGWISGEDGKLCGGGRGDTRAGGQAEGSIGVHEKRRRWYTLLRRRCMLRLTRRWGRSPVVGCWTSVPRITC
jgi:hypothetical protein